ncbi:hypothetical protein CBR_g11127 [Chara braunii]|uniref:Uncharacterized protein n=1 Tax=Chara braunii TaxID=69332 RepID=A0A388KQ64_CHABU|nr:hypothetical protein CBR_g11127 [Chara braunii]|eukprot:GBG72194.1 hypothetical protein CBR_g11127 [Chara braunii]
MGRTQTKQRQLRMPYARKDPRMLGPVEKEGGLEVSLLRRVRAGEYFSSWWGMLIGTDTFIWIESGFDDERECAIVRVTLYASAAFWIEHGIELALRHGSLLAKPLRVAEAAATKWAREVSRDGEERILTRVVVSIMAGESGFAKILLWRSSCQMKVLLRGGCSVAPVAGPPSQAELNGLQKQVGVLEERLARLEEARNGKRKASEGASSGPTAGGEAEAMMDYQELLPHKKAPRGRACAPERGGGEGVIEVKEEQEPSMVPPVIAPEPEGGPINREVPLTAGRGRQGSEWWPEHWVKVVCDHWGKIGRTPQGSKEKGVTGEKGEPEPPKLSKAQRKARNQAQEG